MRDHRRGFRSGRDVEVVGAPDRLTFRHPLSAVLYIAVALVAFGAMAAQIDGDRAGPLELDVFRALNALPAFLAYVFWLPMQFGNFLVLPLGDVAALISRRWRLAAAFAIAGVGKYGVAVTDQG